MRVLFYGLGGIGQRHLRLLRELRPGVEIAAVRVKNRSFEIGDNLIADRTVDIMRKYNIQRFESTTEAVKFDPDIAIVANPTSIHLNTAMELVRYGIPVFVEKPISNNMVGVDELLKVSSRENIPVFVGYMMRFHPAAIKLKELLENNVLGRIYEANVVVNSYFPDWHPYEQYSELYAGQKELGGGVVLTEIHEIDLLCWYFGAPIRVASMGGKLSALDIDVEDTVSVLMEHSFNSVQVFVAMQMSFVQKTQLRQITIQGEYGSLQWDISKGVILLKDYFNDLHKKWEFNDVPRNDLFKAQLRHVLQCVEERVIPEGTLEAIKVIQVTAVAIQESLQSGQFVEVRL